MSENMPAPILPFSEPPRIREPNDSVAAVHSAAPAPPTQNYPANPANQETTVPNKNISLPPTLQLVSAAPAAAPAPLNNDNWYLVRHCGRRVSFKTALMYTILETTVSTAVIILFWSNILWDVNKSQGVKGANKTQQWIEKSPVFNNKNPWDVVSYVAISLLWFLAILQPPVGFCTISRRSIRLLSIFLWLVVTVVIWNLLPIIIIAVNHHNDLGNHPLVILSLVLVALFPFSQIGNWLLIYKVYQKLKRGGVPWEPPRPRPRPIPPPSVYFVSQPETNQNNNNNILSQSNHVTVSSPSQPLYYVVTPAVEKTTE